jgi:hypothetical protein
MIPLSPKSPIRNKSKKKPCPNEIGTVEGKLAFATATESLKNMFIYPKPDCRKRSSRKFIIYPQLDKGGLDKHRGMQRRVGLGTCVGVATLFARNNRNNDRLRKRTDAWGKYIDECPSPNHVPICRNHMLGKQGLVCARQVVQVVLEQAQVLASPRGMVSKDARVDAQEIGVWYPGTSARYP